MILSKRPEIERFLKAPDRGIRAAVIHGKDRSGVAERESLTRKVGVHPEIAHFTAPLGTTMSCGRPPKRAEKKIGSASMFSSRTAMPPMSSAILPSLTSKAPAAATSAKA